MNKTLVLGLLLLSDLPLFGQATQNVVVMEYNGKSQKTPLAQVEIAVNNAGSTISDTNGQASLRFRTQKPGDRIQVRRIGKEGYEIFNKEALEQWVISSTNTFTIVLCKSSYFRQLYDQYMRVSSQSYEVQYKKEQNRLAAERKAGKLKQQEYDQELKNLADSYAEQLENLEHYVEQFTRIDLSAISEQEQKIIDLIQEGKIEEAIAKYEELDLLSKYQQQSKELQSITNAQDSLRIIRQEKKQTADSLKIVIDLMNEKHP